MQNYSEKLKKCYESVRAKTNFVPQIALILGSGLGDYAEGIDIVSTIHYSEIEGFPVSTVSGHKGRFVFGYVEGVPVVVMQGRVHYYEGYAMQDVVLPTRLMGLLGAKVLFLTNASGGVNYNFKAGDFMMITDQISCLVPSPLIGPNLDELGTRFPDMSEIYDKKLREVIRKTSQEIGVPIQEGVYMQFSGPNFETPHEIKMARILGADAVGMSTACEATAANHMGLQICGISCITNLGCGMLDVPLSDADVRETADRVAPLFKKLVTASIVNIAKVI